MEVETAELRAHRRDHQAGREGTEDMQLEEQLIQELGDNCSHLQKGGFRILSFHI